MTQGIQRCWTVRNSEIVDVAAVVGAGGGDDLFGAEVGETKTLAVVPGNPGTERWKALAPIEVAVGKVAQPVVGAAGEEVEKRDAVGAVDHRFDGAEGDGGEEPGDVGINPFVDDFDGVEETDAPLVGGAEGEMLAKSGPLAQEEYDGGDAGEDDEGQFCEDAKDRGGSEPGNRFPVWALPEKPGGVPESQIAEGGERSRGGAGPTLTSAGSRKRNVSR